MYQSKSRSSYEDSHYGRWVAAAVLAVVLLIAGVWTWSAYNWSKVSASEAACVYNGGPLDNTNYKGSAAPGSGRQGQGFYSKIIEYPIGIVQYDKTDGLADVAVSVGGYRQTYSPTLNFTISSVPDEDGKPMACNLIEQHLKRLGATDFDDDVADSRWVQQFLNVRVQPSVINALPRVLSNGDPTDLFLNQDNARDEAAKQVGLIVGETLNTQLGGNFFCAPNYRYGQDQEACGQINVVLPEPVMDEDALAIIRAPQEARTKADNEIAVAQEEARSAAGVAAQREEEAKSAEQRATADETIANEQNRSLSAEIDNEYLWCERLVELGQNCALVKAAEQGIFPQVITGDGPAIAIAPTPPAPAEDE